VTLPDSTHILTSQQRVIERFRIRVVGGPDVDQSTESTGVELTIGVAPGNHLRLTDPSVSRHHCSLNLTPAGVELRDLGSTNGTTLGGYRVNSAFVTHGAMIGVGASLLAFEETNETLSEPLSSEPYFGPVLGQNQSMRRLFAMAKRIAPSDATVLLEGETGTGKGLFAAAIHEASPRAAQPFVVVDCGALPPTLIESELFGHMKGAFTGAGANRKGLFEAASGGTVFLDEVGELPKELQPKLLRVLESREIRPIGSDVRHPVDIRVIAATNRDLRRDVNAGTFRSDLWYRLNTFRLEVPPLRERRDDIPLLVAHFYAQLADDPGTPPPPELIASMQRGSWPGNVRELRSAVERAVIFDDPDAWRDGEVALRLEPAASTFEPSISFRAAKLRATRRWECSYLEELVRRNNGNLSQAARAARMDRGYLRELLRRYKIRAGNLDD
jgi:transcriptional regulator with GAF, ATPase, and Fis domain